MSPEESKIKELTQGYELLIAFCYQIAFLPLEKWDADLDRAEAVAPFTDPTLYRTYIQSDKPKALRKLIKAALQVKAVVKTELPIDDENRESSLNRR